MKSLELVSQKNNEIVKTLGPRTKQSRDVSSYACNEKPLNSLSLLHCFWWWHVIPYQITSLLFVHQHNHFRLRHQITA